MNNPMSEFSRTAETNALIGGFKLIPTPFYTMTDYAMTDNLFTPDDYTEIRRRGVALHTKIFKKLSGDDIKTCSKHLGIRHNKRLVINSDTEMDLFTDYAIYGYRPHGFNMAEKFLRLFHKQADDFELRLLQHMRDAHYAIYQIEETDGQDRIEVVDVFSKKIYSIMDYQMAKTGYPGLIVAGYLIDFDGFSIQTGAAVLVTRDILLADEVTRIIDQINDDQLAHFLIDPAHGAKLARAIISAAFKLQQTNSINYHEV